MDSRISKQNVAAEASVSARYSVYASRRVTSRAAERKVRYSTGACVHTCASGVLIVAETRFSLFFRRGRDEVVLLGCTVNVRVFDRVS